MKIMDSLKMNGALMRWHCSQCKGKLLHCNAAADLIAFHFILCDAM